MMRMRLPVDPSSNVPACGSTFNAGPSSSRMVMVWVTEPPDVPFATHEQEDIHTAAVTSTVRSPSIWSLSMAPMLNCAEV